MGALIASAAFPAVARAQNGPHTITNTASIEWDSVGKRQTLLSNTVVTTITANSTATVTSFAAIANNDITSQLGASCTANPLDAAPGGAIDIGKLKPTDHYNSDEAIVLMVERPSAITDPSKIETLRLAVHSGSDTEILTFVETAANSGQFTAAILADVTGAGVSYDCHLRALVDGHTVLNVTDVNSDKILGSVNILVTRKPGQNITPLAITKAASRPDAEAGDVIQYHVGVANPDNVMSGEVTVTDRMPAQMRYKAGSATINGKKILPSVQGQTLLFSLPSVNAGEKIDITYLLEVRPGAQSGDAFNRVQAKTASGIASNVAAALVRIHRNGIAERLTVIGRVVDGDCSSNPAKSHGLGNVRIMTETGNYVVTDENGMYRLEDLQTGTHVVQIDEQTIGDRKAVSCSTDLRSAGSSVSRFVDGSGGMLKRVDFNVVAGPPRKVAHIQNVAKPLIVSDQDAAGGNRDWLANQAPGIDWVFPAIDYNPRAPSIRAIVKHLPGQKVTLFVDGKRVDPVTNEGTRKNADGTVAISQWHGIPIDREANLEARVTSEDGKPIKTITRKVYFSNSAVHAELVPSMSLLIADGVTRPIIAIRVFDSRGRPVHQGMTGEFSLPDPYRATTDQDAQQARQLAGIEQARPSWHTIGDDGIALVELQPTTATGAVVLMFNFRDGQRQREQRIETWMSPGDQPWTIVGLTEGTVGFNQIDRHLESTAGSDKLTTDERLAFYAKGRIKGQWLMTAAYDSRKKTQDSRFGGLIEPNAYYTIYADRSEQRSAAASVRKLYLKLERPQFYALFGDFQTNIDEPKLTRYLRSLNGLKAEFHNQRISASAFAADTPTTHRHSEMQGNGLSGPYFLLSRHILANSEQLRIEVRDRINSDKIIEDKILTRYQDYDVNYFDGTVRFYAPVLSRDFDGNPRFIVVDYEVNGVAARKMVAGGRIVMRTKNEKLQLGASIIHDADDSQAGNMIGADIKIRPDSKTEIRAEIATSRSTETGTGVIRRGTAWRVEAERHTSKGDILAYATETPAGFGVGQTSPIDSGMRKYGAEGRVRINKQLEATLTALHEQRLDTGATRNAGTAQVTYHGQSRDLRAGLIIARDNLGNGKTANSTLLQLGATQRLFHNKLEVGVQSDVPIGKADSIDFPRRSVLSGRYIINTNIAVVGSYEIAKAGVTKAKTGRMGFEVTPWTGGKFSVGGNVQDSAGYGSRSFANFGAGQSVPIGKSLTIDATLDGNKTIGGISPSRVINPNFPVANGGFTGSGALTEDFLAITGGATWRPKNWTIAGRAEWRRGERETRHGLTIGALRQVGEGKALGGALSWYDAKLTNGAKTKSLNAQLSWAYRPFASNISILDKLEVREDRVTGATAGQQDILGNTLNITGNAHSIRAINSLAVNWTLPEGHSMLEPSEVALFWGTRYVSDRYNKDDIKGFSNIFGADVRYNFGHHIEAGFSGTVRAGLKFSSIQYSGGPQIGISPFDNAWLQIGYNVSGYRDHDFEQERYTHKGAYATFRLKFDQNSLGWLGLGKH